MANSAGKFSGLVLTAPADVIERSTPSGHLAVPGRHDPCTRRAQIAADAAVPECVAVVAVVPPRPADTELATWAWDAASERWQPVPTDAAVAAEVRAWRDAALAACDWTQLRDVSPATAALWEPYRQALRDLTSQPGFPRSIVRPDPPGSLRPAAAGQNRRGK